MLQRRNFVLILAGLSWWVRHALHPCTVGAASSLAAQRILCCVDNTTRDAFSVTLTLITPAFLIARNNGEIASPSQEALVLHHTELTSSHVVVLQGQRVKLTSARSVYPDAFFTCSYTGRVNDVVMLWWFRDHFLKKVKHVLQSRVPRVHVCCS